MFVVFRFFERYGFGVVPRGLQHVHCFACLMFTCAFICFSTYVAFACFMDASVPGEDVVGSGVSRNVIKQKSRKYNNTSFRLDTEENRVILTLARAVYKGNNVCVRTKHILRADFYFAG